jgi:hypothetical protein
MRHNGCYNTTAGPVYIIAGVLSFAFAHRVGVDIGALVPASAGSGLKSTVSKVHTCLQCMMRDSLHVLSLLQLCAGTLLQLANHCYYTSLHYTALLLFVL